MVDPGVTLRDYLYRLHSFFAADFGSFSYNQTRLDAGAMNFC
jgi:hypothetical protein